MEGWILLNSKGKRLARGKWWSIDDGWVWSDEEVESVLQESRSWDYKPTHKQKAYFNGNDGSVAVIGSLVQLN